MDSPDTRQQETESENLNDVIANTFDELEAQGESVETDEPEVEVSAEDTTEVVEAEQEDTEEITEEVEASEKTEGNEVTEELQEEIQEAADSDYNEPAPDRWADDIKEVYNALPPHARKAMLEGIYKPMQRSYTQSTQELAQMRSQIQPMLEAAEHYRGDFERMGVNPVEAFRTQLAWAAHLHKVGAEQGLRDMSQAYGLGDKPSGGQENDEYLTPTERALKKQVTDLEQKISGTQKTIEERNAAEVAHRQNAYKQEVQSTLHQFVTEKTEDGSLKHPHMKSVANGVAGILRGGLVKNTDDYGQPVSVYDQIAQAYHMACNLNPATRTLAPKKRQVSNAKSAQKVSVVTKHPATEQSSEGMPMSSFIEKTYDELAGRG